MFKFVESRNASERSRLVPVIATVLQFSPQELERAQAANPLEDASSGLLGGVWSLWGGSSTSAPAPKPLAMPANYRTPSSSSLASGVDEDPDEDEAAAALNPFAV